MFSFSASISINPVYNPYYFYASAGGGTYVDTGWTVYFVGDIGDDWFYGDGFSDTMWGDEGDDVLSGGGGDDDLYGGADHDILIGGDGDDDLYGGSGNDHFDGGAGFDVHYGGTGIDTVNYVASASRVLVSLKDNIGLGYGDSAGDTYYSIENVIGSDHNDLIIGTDGIGGNALYGGDGEDDLWGEGGDDLIVGGAGNDDMRGGTGRDTFEWNAYSLNGEGADRIRDFEVGEDALLFNVVDPERTEWVATETEYEGASGLMVEIYDSANQFGLAVLRYDVFLDDVTEEDFTADSLEIY